MGATYTLNILSQIQYLIRNNNSDTKTKEQRNIDRVYEVFKSINLPLGTKVICCLR